MLQESAFRRIAVRAETINENDQLPLLEEARESVQAALDGIANGSIRAAKGTLQNLMVERASLYGFLANNRIRQSATSAEIWSSYEAAREAIKQAVSITDTYFPLDVGLWTPADILRQAPLTETQRAELTADIYATLDQVDPQTLPEDQKLRFEARRQAVGQQLRNQALSDSAYQALEEAGSTAGYFLRARSLGPDLSKASVTNTEGARDAADYLQARLAKIGHDERCLSLLLEYRWIAELGRRPLRGERQPLPYSELSRRDILQIVRALNHCSGSSARHGIKYLEAVLAWVLGDEQAAQQLFRHLSNETEYEVSGRIIRRHIITDAHRHPRKFKGRIEGERSEGHWRLRVDGLNQMISVLSRDFPNEDLGYGRSLVDFAIAFNFIGPIADPIRGRG